MNIAESGYSVDRPLPFDASPFNNRRAFSDLRVWKRRRSNGNRMLKGRVPHEHANERVWFRRNFQRGHCVNLIRVHETNQIERRRFKTRRPRLDEVGRFPAVQSQLAQRPLEE
jgi:hypothetical protein